jgi:hypothetical protein
MFRTIHRWREKRREKSEAYPVEGIFGRLTPEALCEIDPSKMAPDEVRRRLAVLYKRHNHAAGSLDPERRAEAERMLEAIVHCREKYVDAVAGR